MKNLLKNIWQAPAASVSGGLVAALTFLTATEEVQLPKGWVIAMGATAAFLSFLSGPNKL